MHIFLPAKRAFWNSNCLWEKDSFKQKETALWRFLFLLRHLFYDGKNHSYKGFCKANGFFFSYKSGKTFAISQIFEFCPAGGNLVTVFKLAAVIIKRNVREHKIKSFRHLLGARLFLAANFILENCPFVVYIITQRIMQINTRQYRKLTKNLIKNCANCTKM